MSETSEVVRPTIDALNRIPGVFAYRVHSGKVKVRNGWMKLADSGFPDIACVVQGAACFFEAKKRRTKNAAIVFKKDQLSTHDTLRRCGARVVVIESVAEAIAVVREILSGETARASVMNEVGPATIGVAASPVSQPILPTTDRKGVSRAGE